MHRVQHGREKRESKKERRARKWDTKCKVQPVASEALDLMVLDNRTLGLRACKVASGGALQAIKGELDY